MDRISSFKDIFLLFYYTCGRENLPSRGLSAKLTFKSFALKPVRCMQRARVQTSVKSFFEMSKFLMLESCENAAAREIMPLSPIRFADRFRLVRFGQWGSASESKKRKSIT